MLRVSGLTRVYRLGGQEIRALDGVDLEIRQGEYLRVVGASGSGKSTLLNLLAGLDTPTSGRIETPEGVLSEMPPRRLAGYRARVVGMVFQTFNLILHLTAQQNVELGMLFLDLPRVERRRRAVQMLERLGLGARTHHRPRDLSGGEQQRVALARALAKEPSLLLADEPTGNLDQATSAEIARLLGELNADGLTVVLVTHNLALAADEAERTLRMNYGRIVEETGRAAGGPAR
jgi:putative ABC transport system ATP-binding protein